MQLWIFDETHLNLAHQFFEMKRFWAICSLCILCLSITGCSFAAKHFDDIWDLIQCGDRVGNIIQLISGKNEDKTPYKTSPLYVDTAKVHFKSAPIPRSTQVGTVPVSSLNAIKGVSLKVNDVYPQYMQKPYASHGLQQRPSYPVVQPIRPTVTVTCVYCNGTGKQGTKMCSRCYGRGKI